MEHKLWEVVQGDFPPHQRGGLVIEMEEKVYGSKRKSKLGIQMFDTTNFIMLEKSHYNVLIMRQN